MHAISLRRLCERNFTMHRHADAVAPGNRQQRSDEGYLLALRQVLLAHADPAAATCDRACHYFNQRPPCLSAVGDKQKRRFWELHVPTRPNCGLDGSACAIFGIRPASRDQRPASTAARMLVAIMTGFRAFDTAVLRSTAEQPSSIAIAASEDVPMPASSTTGTGERAQMISMTCWLQIPSPEPIGDPSGITAAAPASASLRQTTGSSVQYGSTVNPLATSVSVACTSSSV